MIPTIGGVGVGVGVHPVLILIATKWRSIHVDVIQQWLARWGVQLLAGHPEKNNSLYIVCTVKQNKNFFIALNFVVGT